MQVECTNLDSLVVNKLPDGSRVIVDAANETVFALNSTAGAAWDACSSQTTLARVTEHMRGSFDSGVTEEVAERAIFELEEKKLVKVSQGSRRQFIGTMSAAVALPLVVALTMTDQRAYATTAKSKVPTPTPPKPIKLL